MDEGCTGKMGCHSVFSVVLHCCDGRLLLEITLTQFFNWHPLIVSQQFGSYVWSRGSWEVSKGNTGGHREEDRSKQEVRLNLEHTSPRVRKPIMILR